MGKTVVVVEVVHFAFVVVVVVAFVFLPLRNDQVAQGLPFGCEAKVLTVEGVMLAPGWLGICCS